MQYFSPEEFGEEYAGYYLFYSTYAPTVDDKGNTDGENRRSYVLKSATKDLQGDWVNPVTGEKNIPALFCSDTDPSVNKAEWTAGESTMRYEGKTYALWIGQTGRYTENFKQTMYLSEMANPWTVTGPIPELVNPEYEWERGGYGYSSSEKIWYPAVIEGATPVLNDDGTLFVLYAGSGYWTPAYCLGQMTYLGGGLFDINNWKKNPFPIFKKNNEVCGVGGPSLVTSPDGKENYLLYHAYLGSDTTGYRYCFMEPYTVDETGFHVGQDNSPSPLATEFTVKVNGTPLFKKISGFDNFDSQFLYIDGAKTVKSATSKTIAPKIYGGIEYDSSYGEISYRCSKDGISFTSGLPKSSGKYIIEAVLSGNYAYEGLGGRFEITVGGSPLLIITAITAAGSVTALCVILFLSARKKKEQ